MLEKRIIAIIPARGGSEGIPGKNIIDFCGKPLVAWSIIQSLSTKLIKSVYVSSDSDEILKISKGFGAETIKRPDEISGDSATTESAIKHALDGIEQKADLVALLQPTSPLRKPDDLAKAIEEFEKNGCDSLFSGAVLKDFLIWEKSEEGKSSSFNYDYRKRGIRQNRKPQYVENGSFYIFKPEVLREDNRLGGKIGIYLMEDWQTFEIDGPEDIPLTKKLFEWKLLKKYEEKEKKPCQG